jgi:hypothetical protein
MNISKKLLIVLKSLLKVLKNSLKFLWTPEILQTPEIFLKLLKYLEISKILGD